MITNKRSTRLAIKLVIVGFLAFLYGCDMLEQDSQPDGTEIKIEGTKLYTLANSNAYVNLYSLVKTQQQVQFKITSQPRKGNISEMQKGIIQYAPDKTFKKGSDSFAFAVLSLENKLLLQDSVIIVVGDSTALPCGNYAMPDSVLAPFTGSVIIDVLKNDVLCDSAHITLQVYKPTSTSVPLFGNAQVTSNNRIEYTPGANFTGIDYIFYKISSTQDTSKYTFGKVSIHVNTATPAFALFDDYYSFKKDSLTSDSLRLYIFQNDQLPVVNGSNYSSSILAAPHKGNAIFYATSTIIYTITPPRTVMNDTLTYQVCRGSQCKTAKAFIRIY